MEFFTTYQTITTISSLLVIALIIGGLFLYYTNDIKPAIITFFSMLLIPILSAVTLIILYRFFDVIPSEKHTLIMWSVIFINAINLSVLISKYAKEVLEKDFDIDHVTRHHFKSTLNLFTSILLLLGAVCIFMDANMLIILIPIIVISSIVIWFNHLMARLLLKEK
jgi:hypothetical protein